MTTNERPKAIPQRYAGVTFRSKTEARWAVFFDTLSIPWVYEIQGFDLGGEAYLPDFLLPEQWVWAEVKSSAAADPAGVDRWRNLTAQRQERGVLLTDMWSGPPEYLVTGPAGDGGMWDDDQGRWYCCPGGYHYDIQPWPAIGCRRCLLSDGYWHEDPRVEAAFTRARSFRFGRG